MPDASEMERTKNARSGENHTYSGIIIGCCVYVCQGTDKQARFSLAISAAQTAVKVGSEIKIDVTLTDTTGQAFLIAGDAGARGEFEYAVHVEDGNGHEPHETKYLRALRREDSGNAGDTTTLVINFSMGFRQAEPGRALKSEIHLDKLYDLPPGSYTVQVEDADEESKIIVKSNKLKFTVSP